MTIMTIDDISPDDIEVGRELLRSSWVNEEELAEAGEDADVLRQREREADRTSTRLNSRHTVISYAVYCLKKKKKNIKTCYRKL